MHAPIAWSSLRSLLLTLALTGCGGGFVFVWSGDDGPILAPTVTIENPTSAPVFETRVAVLAMGGSVANATRVQVLNTATGTVVEAQLTSPGGRGHWMIDGIALQLGTNVIVATAEGGSQGNTAEDSLTVTRTP